MTAQAKRSSLVINLKALNGVFFLLLIMLFPPSVLFAQDRKTISGSIVDGVTKLPLPYAGVSLKNFDISTASNEQGGFSLSVPEDAFRDTLLVKYMGYRIFYIPLSSLKTPLIISLEQVSAKLNEVVIKPMPPTFYINMAMAKVNDLYPNSAYETEAFYRERITENNNYLKFNECVFKTYYPAWPDTLKNQHQLLLHRQPGLEKEMKFMAKERKKQEEKEYKNKPANVEKRTGTDFIFRLGGPETMLRYGIINKKYDDFLDSTNFKHYTYSFAKSSTYNSKELMVIDFKSKGQTRHLKKEGKIYIDLATNAVFKITGSGEFVIPLTYRSLMFLYGVSAKELTFTGEKTYKLVNKRWYPERIELHLKIVASNRHLFGTNEHADFDIERLFSVYELKQQGAVPVIPSKRFRHRNAMKTQVHNDAGLSWQTINIH